MTSLRDGITALLAGRTRFSKQATAHGLARDLGCQHPEVSAELTRMAAEGLVEHDPPTGQPRQRYRWRLIAP
jgi:predicted ArsR family transcriptional regulator